MGVTRPDTTSTMSKLSSDNEVMFIGLVLEGLIYGLYSGLFIMFLHHQSPKKDSDKQNIVFHSICALYALSVVLFALDIMLPVYEIISKPIESSLQLSYAQATFFGLCDFIAQFVLIYRCWIVWGRNIRVVIIPSILAFAFLGQSIIFFFDWLISISLPLACWLAANSALYISSGEFVFPIWMYATMVSSLAMSLIVNALVTGLIVFKILKVFRQVENTSNAQTLGATGGSRLWHTILVLIESGTALFFIQLVRLAVTISNTDTAYKGWEIVFSIHDMLAGITPTIIVLRTSMGLSFHDEKSMDEEVALSFVPSNHPNSVMQRKSITMVDEDNRGDDINIQKSNKIDI